MCGGDAREKPVPTASHSFDSENVRRTCLPSRPVAPVMSAVGGISIFDLSFPIIRMESKVWGQADDGMSWHKIYPYEL